MKYRRLVVFVIIAVMVASAAYSGRKSIIYVRDAESLIILASLSHEEVSFNPYSTNFQLISPDMAVWVLNTFDYPYDSCDGYRNKWIRCEKAKITIAGALIGIVSPEGEERLYQVIDTLISKGVPVDAYSSDGFTALQASILYNNPKLVSKLLDNGADPCLPIKRKGKAEGENSFEFTQRLYSRNPDGFRELNQLIRGESPNNCLQRGAATPRA